MLFYKKLCEKITILSTKSPIITIIISLILALYILKDILLEKDIGLQGAPSNNTPFHTSAGGEIFDTALEDTANITSFHTTRNKPTIAFTTSRYSHRVMGECDKKNKATIKPLRLNSDFFVELCKPINYKSYTMLSIISMTNDSFIVSFRGGNMELFKKYLHFCIPDGLKCETIIGPYPNSRNGCYYYSAYSALSICYDAQKFTKYAHILNKKMDNQDLYVLNHIVDHFFR